MGFFSKNLYNSFGAVPVAVIVIGVRFGETGPLQHGKGIFDRPGAGIAGMDILAQMTSFLPLSYIEDRNPEQRRFYDSARRVSRHQGAFRHE